MDEICSHHGILIKWTEDTYGFGHLALQEFMTAKWYADEQRWQQLIKKETLINPWWRNVLALCFASLSDATDSLRHMWEYNKLSELERLNIIAHCLKYDPLITATSRDMYLNKILNLYHNGNAQEHDAALYMLIGIGDGWTSPKIKKSLGSNHLPSEEFAKLFARSKRMIE